MENQPKFSLRAPGAITRTETLVYKGETIPSDSFPQSLAEAYDALVWVVLHNRCKIERVDRDSFTLFHGFTKDYYTEIQIGEGENARFVRAEGVRMEFRGFERELRTLFAFLSRAINLGRIRIWGSRVHDVDSRAVVGWYDRGPLGMIPLALRGSLDGGFRSEAERQALEEHGIGMRELAAIRALPSKGLAAEICDAGELWIEDSLAYNKPFAETLRALGLLSPAAKVA